MATNNKPTHTLRGGNIKATIWQNVSEKGAFFATTFSRPLKDQSGAWRNGHCAMCVSFVVVPVSKGPFPVDTDLFGVILRPSTKCEDSVMSILQLNV
jgi:hypothetical protein